MKSSPTESTQLLLWLSDQFVWLMRLCRAFSPSSLNFNSFSHVSQSRRIIISSADSIWNDIGYQMFRNKNTFHETYEIKTSQEPHRNASEVVQSFVDCNIFVDVTKSSAVASFLWGENCSNIRTYWKVPWLSNNVLMGENSGVMYIL